jgi:protocatechuate 3,4-dioxygenase beta subunit
MGATAGDDPAGVSGRTRHIHAAQAPDQPVLTTQLYFPNEPQNATDGIYDPALEMDLQDGETASSARSTRAEHRLMERARPVDTPNRAAYIVLQDIIES